LFLWNVEKHKLAAHAVEEGHTIVWDKTDIVQTEPNSNYRKYKKASYVLCIKNLISQPCMYDVSCRAYSPTGYVIPFDKVIFQTVKLLNNLP
jgi:hypothetical protein